MGEAKARGSEAIRVAIQLEKDGMAFYGQAADKTTNEFGKRMFRQLVREEERHLEILNEICTGADALPDEQAGDVFKGHVTTIFKQLTDDVKKRLQADPSDVEALKIAMGMEAKGYQFYEDAAKQATEDSEKELFKRLAIEENGHWLILEDTYTYFTDHEKWDIRANPPILDGGP